MSHAPYIMPDGRPFGQFLNDTQDEAKTVKRSRSAKQGRRADKLPGWSTRSHHNQGVPALGDDEVESRRLGRDRRRRYLNEKLLRDMAGVMTASDMEALFKPAPFGDTGYESPLSRITEHNNLPIWDLFRNIDEDRQNNTLHKWESAARSQKHGRGEVDASCRESSGLAALQSWSRVPKRAREALKRCSPEVVETLELPILEYMDRATNCDGDEPLSLELDDAYQRLMVHGIAIYHKLQSQTSPLGLIQIQWNGRGSKSCSGSPAMTCADICFALTQHLPQGLTPASLHAHWRRMNYGTDADSEASYILV